ncbi:CHS1 [Mytilus edulis]|uniref:CHS1 n=1 Tax=Mytilus edulis TaxID=6550 RepID=A0A8S3RCW0_MYTED|nr:CHS1 [Mytilus edulis]
MTDYIPNSTVQDFTSETQSENSVPPSYRSVETKIQDINIREGFDIRKCRGIRNSLPVLQSFNTHSMTSGITLIMSSFTLPSILNIIKQIALARNRQKFILRMLRVIIAVIAVLIQCGVVVCMIVRPNIVFSDTNQTHYTIQEKIYLVISLVGISMGYCQNFLNSNLEIEIFNWRIEVDKARSKIDVIMCIIKVGIFLLMAKILLPDIEWTYTEDSANLKDTFLEKCLQILFHHRLMFIYIYCAIFASYESVLACKLDMQRISFFVPLALVPLVCFGAVIGFCYNWPDDSNVFGLAVSCPSVEIDSLSMWIGSSIGLLFVLPTRDNFFSSLGLLMKRKDETIEKKSNKGHEDEENSFENEDCKKPERRKRPSLHIVFDDAFETDKKSRQRLPNEWVKKLVECMEEASTSVARGHTKWDINPTKTTTPYGGRLNWTMPGGQK